MFWYLVAVFSIVTGFFVGRFAVSLLVFIPFMVTELVRDKPSGNEDVEGIVLFVLMIYTVGGTVIGVTARRIFGVIRREIHEHENAKTNIIEESGFYPRDLGARQTQARPEWWHAFLGHWLYSSGFAVLIFALAIGATALAVYLVLAGR